MGLTIREHASSKINVLQRLESIRKLNQGLALRVTAITDDSFRDRIHSTADAIAAK